MILVTGASGLLGSHLVTSLVEKGLPVKALYRSAIPSFPGSEKINWVQGDILDVSALQDALQDVEQVYHCAGMVSFHPKNKRDLFHTNVEGTANMVNSCLQNNVQKLVFVSSVAALGKLQQQQPVNETMAWTEATGNSIYGKSKYLAEMEVWRGIGEGLNAVIVNPSIILGAGDWTKGSTAIFKSAYDEFPWYTEGVTGFVDVADTVNAMIALMNSSLTAQRFIISAYNISFRQLFTQIAVAFGKKPPHKRVTPLLADLVWRMEAVKSLFNGKQPLLTKETASTAQEKVYFDNSKLLKYLPGFTYSPLEQTILNICAELRQQYNLL